LTEIKIASDRRYGLKVHPFIIFSLLRMIRLTKCRFSSSKAALMGGIYKNYLLILGFEFKP
jgi:hypothetical protein